MLIQVNHHSGVPVYRQILEQITFAISSGVLEGGEKLPTVRTLARELGINPMTVSKAYSFLEHDGYVSRRAGKPLIVNMPDASQLQRDRTRHLTEALRPIAHMAHQLGIERQEAIQLFSDLLEGGNS